MPEIARNSEAWWKALVWSPDMLILCLDSISYKALCRIMIKTGLKAFLHQSAYRLSVYLLCYPSSISIILMLEALLIDLHSKTLSSALGATRLFATLVPGFVCWSNKTQESGLAVGPGPAKATARAAGLTQAANSPSATLLACFLLPEIKINLLTFFLEHLCKN